MAKSILEYWSGSAWVQAKTVNPATNAADQNDAVVRLEIREVLNNPRVANIEVANSGRDPFSSGTAADRYGPLNDVFTDFMTIRIVEDDSKVILFQGKLYDVKKDYDLQRGNIIKLYARDNLAELADYPTDDKVEPISSSDGARTSDRRSDIIKTIIRDSASDPHMASLMISSSNIAIDDTQKIEASDRTFSNDGVTEEFKVSSEGKQGLKVINSIASKDGHGTGELDDFGFDYYVDTQQALGASNPAMDFNYFKRGSRSPYQGTPGNFDGLTIEHPIASGFTETGNKTMMTPGYDFDQPKHDLFTGAVMQISRELTGENGKTISVNRSIEIEVLEGNVSSEFLHAKDNSGTAWKQKSFARTDDASSEPENFADYLWKLGGQVDSGAQVNNASNIASDATIIQMDGSHTIQVGDVIMIDTENMYVSYVNAYPNATAVTVKRQWGHGHSSYSTAASHNDNATIYKHPIVGRLQYQSVTSGEGFILISFERDIVSSKLINTQRKNFEAIATGDSDITLTNGNDHFVFNPSTERVANKWGIKKLVRVSGSEGKTLDSVRKNIAKALKGGKTTRTECNIGTYRPPFIYHETYAASAATTTRIAVADSAANRNAFDIGLRVGMPIAKVSGTALHGTQDAYGYVTSISDTDSNTATVTAALNTGNWTGYTGSGNKLRFYIPIRAGHYIYVNNPIANFAGYMFIQELTYTEENGVQGTFYKGTGVNTAGTSTVGTGNFASGIHTLVQGETAKLEDRSANPPMGGLGFKYRPSTVAGTTDTAIFSGTDRDTLGWTGGELTVGQMSKFTILAGNTGNMTTTADSVTGYPPLYVIYFDPDQVPNANGKYIFSSSIESSYNADMDHVFIGHARASSVSTGKALFVRDGSGMGFFGGNDGIGEDSFSAALFKKSVQPYTTNVVIYPGKHTSTSGSAATPDNLNRYVHATNGAAGTGVDGTISFADDTTVPLKFNNGTTDTDVAPSLDLGTANSVVQYLYYFLADSGDDETSNFSDVTQAIIDVTSSYNLASSESRGLLAIVSTGSNASADEVAIQAFHGKGQNINADTIAANAITAVAIKAGTITTSELNFTPTIGGNTDSTASIRAVAAATSGTVAGIAMNASTFYIGTGTFNNSNTPFFVRGVDGGGGTAGDFSLGDKLVWDDSAETLTITGSGTFTGALSSASGTFTGALNGGTISIGSSNSIFKADSNGIYLGNATFGSAPFRVTPAGVLTTTSAVLGVAAVTVAASGIVVNGTDNTLIKFQDSGTDKAFFQQASNVFKIGTNGGEAAHIQIGLEPPGGTSPYTQSIKIISQYLGLAATDADAIWYKVPDDNPADTEQLTSAAPSYADGSGTRVSTVDGASTTFYELSWAAHDASSLRFKENISALTIDTEKIFSLTPKSFTWKKDTKHKIIDSKGTNQPSFGYIAEEVEEFLPEILGYDAENKPKRLDYKLLSVLLLEEVKKLRTRVDNLEAG